MPVRLLARIAGAPYLRRTARRHRHDTHVTARATTPGLRQQAPLNKSVKLNEADAAQQLIYIHEHGMLNSITKCLSNERVMVMVCSGTAS